MVSLRWRWDGSNGMNASQLGWMQPWQWDLAFSFLVDLTLQDNGQWLQQEAVDLRNQGKSKSALKTLCVVPGILPRPSKKAWENSTRWWYESKELLIGRGYAYQNAPDPHSRWWGADTMGLGTEQVAHCQRSTPRVCYGGFLLPGTARSTTSEQLVPTSTSATSSKSRYLSQLSNVGVLLMLM